MDIKSFLSEFQHQGVKSYFLFETLVSKLLAKHLEEQNKSFSSNLRTGQDELDGLAIDGFDDLLGPTLIEIKLSKRGFDHRTLHRVHSIADANDFKSILLISGNSITANEKDRITTNFQGLNKNIRIKIWDIDDLSKIAEKYAEYVSNLIPELSERAVDNVVTKSVESTPEQWRTKRQGFIAQLKESYLNNDLALFVGAGVSEPAGIPCWNHLLTDLLVSMIGQKLPKVLNVTDEENKALARQFSILNDVSPLLEARYIRSGFGDSFALAVASALYRDINMKGGGTSELLKSISKLCIPRRSGPGIKSVVTYNFDDLIEKHLEAVGVHYRSIFRDVDIASQDELGIYHVHGFLPRNMEQHDGVSESLFVFSEEGYHTLLEDPYAWSNIVQLNFFRECTCLMLGLSMTDPNLRRLLDIAARKSRKAKHFVFMKRPTSSDFSTEPNLMRQEVIDGFFAAHFGLQEASFHELGLNIIWIENFNEISSILDSLRE